MSMPPDDATRLDLAAVRARLAGKTGRAFWRSLDEVVETPAFRAFLEAEFPRQAPPDGVERREFLKLMAASLGLAGLAACTRQPEERIVPYTTAPDGWIPGVPRWFATAVTLEGWAVGVLAESHEGRPTKLEGNPDHPASLGGADSLTQGTILELYDPDRSQALLNRGEIRPWSAFATELGQVRAAQLAREGRGLRILTGNVTSPTLIGQLERLLGELPEARWHVWESSGGRANAYAGARLAYGTTVETYLRLESAATILVLDADLFGRGPGRVRHAKDVARGRKVRTPDGTMSRLWVVESCPTTAGSIADERLAVRSSDVEAIARAVAAGLGVAVPAAADHPAVRAHRRWIDAAVADLRRAGHLATVVAGDGQPPAVHAIVHAVNARLGAVGRTVLHTEPFAAAARDDVGTLAELIGDVRAGAVEALVILDANPVYDAPGDLDVAGALDALPFVVHVGLHPDETAYRAHWHVPMAHSLESWSDARADDGTVTIIQPLVAPLYEGRTLHEVVAVLTGTPGATDHDLVRERWLDRLGGERGWRHALHDGTVPGTEARPVRRRPVANLGAAVGPLPAPAPGVEVVLRPDAGVWDGRFANNGWLQEVSRPVTLLTWDNAALLAPATAERLGVTNDDVIALTRGDRTIEAPVWVVPGHARESVTLALGYGRTRAGRVGTGVGVDVGPLRTHDAAHLVHDVGLRPTGRRYALATTQHHQTMEGRDPARMGTLAEFRSDPQAVSAPHPEVEGTSLYPAHPYEGNAWGMVIDVGACIGCNACVTACIAENNIAVVGRDQVRRGREMHWIRVDRYYAGGLDDPRVLHQPVPCMHCEDAPCEVVCPVNATVHSSEGLNEMVYNRCVGTRYCSNNCPYKVRRFNFYLFSDWNTESLKLQRNPEVTVRSRGVMEKCTYCVQRIEEKRALAKREERPIRDGEIVPACQQTCPTDAIVFGNLNDGESRVTHLRRDPLHYALLAELGTRPRTTYLAGLRNPSADLDEEETG